MCQALAAVTRACRVGHLVSMRRRGLAWGWHDPETIDRCKQDRPNGYHAGCPGAAVRQAVLCVSLAILFLGGARSSAQDLPNNGGGVALPGSSGQASTGSNGQSCWRVQIAGAKPSPYDCLNQQLQQAVQGAASPSPALPLGAGSPSNKVGTFNEQGVSEQYGQNFGKSAIPYRPPAPVYGNSLPP
jgi:hypothetical protein